MALAVVNPATEATIAQLDEAGVDELDAVVLLPEQEHVFGRKRQIYRRAP